MKASHLHTSARRWHVRRAKPVIYCTPSATFCTACTAVKHLLPGRQARACSTQRQRSLPSGRQVWFTVFGSPGGEDAMQAREGQEVQRAAEIKFEQAGGERKQR